MIAGMNLDEAIAVVLSLQHRSQTNMTAELRIIYQRALRVVETHAMETIERVKAKL